MFFFFFFNIFELLDPKSLLKEEDKLVNPFQSFIHLHFGKTYSLHYKDSNRFKRNRFLKPTYSKPSLNEQGELLNP